MFLETNLANWIWFWAKNIINWNKQVIITVTISFLLNQHYKKVYIHKKCWAIFSRHPSKLCFTTVSMPATKTTFVYANITARILHETLLRFKNGRFITWVASHAYKLNPNYFHLHLISALSTYLKSYIANSMKQAKKLALLENKLSTSFFRYS